MINEYYTIKDVAKKWNVSERWVKELCAQGKIDGAVQFGRAWAVPKDAGVCSAGAAEAVSAGALSPKKGRPQPDSRTVSAKSIVIILIAAFMHDPSQS